MYEKMDCHTACTLLAHKDKGEAVAICARNMANGLLVYAFSSFILICLTLLF